MNTYYARSSEGQVLRFRPHAFAPLAKKGEEALQYEAWLLPASSPVPGAIAIASTPDGFHCEATGPAAAIAAYGIRGRGTSLEYRLSPRHEVFWAQFSGCNSIDLIPVDSSDEVAGESVRIAVPSFAAGQQIQFRERPFEQCALAGPLTKAARSFRIVAWHRVQNDEWHPVGASEPIGAEGILLRIPQHQGAFAVVDAGNNLEFVQFFGFGRLVPFNETDRQEFIACYPVAPAQPEEWERWPGWVQNLISGIARHSRDAAEGASTDLGRYLRAAVRETLLGPYLPAGSDRRLELTIEESALACWPALRTILSDLPDAETLTLAIENINSPRFAEALDWCGGRSSALARCLKLLPVRTAQRRLSALLTDEFPSAKTLNRLGAALEAVPSGGAGEARRVAELWRLLQDEFRRDFNAGVEELDHAALADLLWHRRLAAVCRALDVAISDSIETMLNGAASQVERFGRLRTAELMSRCQAAGLLTNAGLLEDYARRQCSIAQSIQALCASAPHKWSSASRFEIERLRQAAEEASTMAAFAASALADAIGSQVRAGVDSLAAESGLPTMDISASKDLDGLLEQAVDFVGILNEHNRMTQERNQDLEYLKSRLPKGVAPDTDEAAEYFRERLQALVEDVGFLLVFCETDEELVSLSDRKRLKAFVADQGKLEDPAETGARRLLKGFRQIESFSPIFQASASNAAKRFSAKSGVSEESFQWWMEKRDLRMASAVEHIGSRRQTLFYRMDPPLASLLWMETSEWGIELISIMERLNDLESARSPTEIDRLNELIARASEIIDERGGLAKLREQLKSDLQNRWKSFLRSGSAPRGVNSDLAGLFELLGRAGATLAAPSTPREEASARLPGGTTTEELRSRLQEYGLWPERRVASHGVD